MDGGGGTIVQVVRVLGETVLRATALLGGCAVLITLGIVNSSLLLPLLALGAAVMLLWRPSQLLTRRLEDIAPGEAAALRRQVDLLSVQVAALQQEQRELRATVRWQEELLERLAAHAPPPAPDVLHTVTARDGYARAKVAS
jgi:hypothetical protein